MGGDKASLLQVEDPNDSIYLRDEGPGPYIPPTQTPTLRAWTWHLAPAVASPWLERDQVALGFVLWQQSLLPLVSP